MQPIAWHHVHPHLWRTISVAGTLDVYRERSGGAWSIRIKRAGAVATLAAEGRELEHALEHAERVAARIARGPSPHEENTARVQPGPATGPVGSASRSDEVAHE